MAKQMVILHQQSPLFFPQGNGQLQQLVVADICQLFVVHLNFCDNMPIRIHFLVLIVVVFSFVSLEPSKPRRVLLERRF